jgi:hypothetical protein
MTRRFQDRVCSRPRRLCKVQAPAKIIHDRVAEIERHDWQPTEKEVRASLLPGAAITQG